MKYQKNESGDLVKVDENVVSAGLQQLPNKDIKSINVFVKSDMTFINLGIKRKKVLIKESGGGLEISSDNFKMEINLKSIINFDEDTRVVIIETKSVKMTLMK